ncbi:MAG TPA: alanine dehydrogenase [Roseiflexaceae bacterium]|nr:alanine dehydrogenase [Roseiflexaceae bacterium]
MDIAIPHPNCLDERRVSLTPAGVHELAAAGHAVYIERGVGLAAGFADSDYDAAGAQIVYNAAEIYRRGQLLVTVDGVPDSALAMLRPGQIVCGFLLLTVMRRRNLAALAQAGVSTLSYELIQDEHGTLPVLVPMSEIVGRLLPQLAAHLLETPSGGRGILLAPVPGIPSAEVVILGAGTVGVNAAYGFSAWGVQTTVFDCDIGRLRRAERICRGRITTRLCTASALDQAVPFADVLIGAVQTPGRRVPQLVSAEHVRAMKPHSVIVDVAIDQGGCVVTSRPTTHSDPTYLAEGVLHYAVPNIPSVVARTASHALNNALLPLIERIAEAGLERACADDRALARGVGLLNGSPASAHVAAALTESPGLSEKVP